MSNDTSEKLTKDFENAAEQQVKNTIDSAFFELVEKPASEINQLPEHIFTQVFLPFFCGEKIINDKKDILISWISIAGTPNKEVEIIDDVGTPLFKVPAIMDSTIIDVKNIKEGQTFFDIIVNYELHKNQLPVVGENYLRNSIDNRFKSLTTDSTSHSINEKRWEDIFIRYGKIKDTSIPTFEAGTKLSDDEMIYD